jgi:hypothetical protein
MFKRVHFNLNLQSFDLSLFQNELTKFKAEFEEHIRWLEPIDSIQRAVGGFRGAIEFMMATDNSHLLPKFWTLVEDLDGVRDESLVKVVPELEQIARYKKYNKEIDESATFIASYNDVADPSWPKLNSKEEFNTLPEAIQQKTIELQTADPEIIRRNTFVESYNDVADPSWPKITTVEEFYALPDAIQQEVQETFNIQPPA